MGCQKPKFVPLPGDIILTQGKDQVPQGIMYSTRVPYFEQVTLVGHTVLSLGFGRVLEINPSQGAVIKDFSEISDPFVVIRNRHWTAAQRAQVALCGLEYVGRPYGRGKIVAQFLDAGIARHLAFLSAALKRIAPRVSQTLKRWAVSEPAIFREFMFADDGSPTCSWATAHCIQRQTGYLFGTSAKAANPDSILDWALAHPQDWEIVYQGEDFDWDRQPISRKEFFKIFWNVLFGRAFRRKGRQLSDCSPLNLTNFY